MAAPVVMLALMAGPYLIARLWSAITSRPADVRRAAAVGLALMFVFTGAGHFAQAELMSRMLPPWVPERVLLVHLSGVLELALAAGLVAGRTRRLAGWIAAILLVAFFPVNVYAALNHVPMGGHAWGPTYLLVRAPVQLAILLWAYWFTIRRPSPAAHERARHAGSTLLPRAG